MKTSQVKVWKTDEDMVLCELVVGEEDCVTVPLYTVSRTDAVQLIQALCDWLGRGYYDETGGEYAQDLEYRLVSANSLSDAYAAERARLLDRIAQQDNSIESLEEQLTVARREIQTLHSACEQS